MYFASSIGEQKENMATPPYGKMPYIVVIVRKDLPARLEARLPADVHALLKRAAELEGRTLTDFVVTASRNAAIRTIEDAEVIRLSVEDQKTLAEALLNPPDPAPALRRAIKRRHQLFGKA
jgi:uncharacterized protein (DUF1778 family)